MNEQEHDDGDAGAPRSPSGPAAGPALPGSDGDAVPFVPIVPVDATGAGAVPAGLAPDATGSAVVGDPRGSGRRATIVAGAAVLAVAIVAAVLVVVARRGADPAAVPAGGGAGTETGGGMPASHPATEPDCVGPGAPPADAGVPPREGGVLSMALAAESDGFDPTRFGFNPSGLLVASTVYDPLAVWQEGRVVPWLAESIEADPTSTVWTIRLRSGVRFHDGLPLDADALRANLEASRANRLLGPAYSPIRDVAVTGPLEVRLTMAAPWPAFANLLTSQFGYVASPAAVGTEAGAKKPVGTGPFRFEEWLPGKRLTVTRNADYWRPGEPHLDRIEFSVVGDAFSRQRALQGGEVDALVTDDADAIAAAEHAGLPTGVGLDTVSFVTLNTLIPPFDDERARRAVALATDRDALVAAESSGLLEPAVSPFPSDNPWCTRDTGAVPYDPEAARALAAGYEADNGSPLAFALLVPTDPVDERVAAQLQAQWAKVGIQVDLEPDPGPAVAMALVGGRYQAGLHRLRPPADPDVLYDWFHAGPASLGKGLNLSRIEDPELDRLLDAGRTTTDADARRAAYEQFVRRLNEVVPFVWLYATPGAVVTTGDVHGTQSLLDPQRQLSAPWASTVWLAP